MREEKGRERKGYEGKGMREEGEGRGGEECEVRLKKEENKKGLEDGKTMEKS